jgi:hypothetical protein
MAKSNGRIENSAKVYQKAEPGFQRYPIDPRILDLRIVQPISQARRAGARQF